MKKLKYLLLALICFSIFSFTTVTAFAEESAVEGEIATESEEIVEDEEILETEEESVEEPKYELTESELKAIIDGALTENQKTTVSTVSQALAKRFDMSPEKLYIICAVALLATLLLVVFLGKFITKTGKVKALGEQVKALSELASQNESDKNKYKELVEVLSKDGFEGVVRTVCAELEASVIKNLKLDSNTIGELLQKADVNVAYIEKVVSALKILAQDAGKTAMLNELCKCPNTELLKTKEVEIEKLKTALGEETVKKVLG